MSVAARPAVSALVVNHNGGDWLRLCLESLQSIAEGWRAADTGSSGCPVGLEVVVVDNASTDGSASAVREFESISALPVGLIEAGRNLGFGAASNLAAARSAGRHLLLLNPDAWLDEESLRRLVDALDFDERLAVVAPFLHYPDGSPQFAWAPAIGVPGEAIQRFRNRFENAAWNHGLLPRLLKALVGAGWHTAACLLVRRSAFEAVGGFDEGFFLYFEDADLCLRLHRAGFRQRQVVGARAWHVRGAATAADRERRLTPGVEHSYRASQLRYYDLHRPRWERAALRRRLRRRFGAIGDEEHRRAMLRLLEEA